MWNAVALRARPRAQMGEHPARPLRDANGARAALPPAHRTGTRMGLPRREIIAAERLPRGDVATSESQEAVATDCRAVVRQLFLDSGQPRLTKRTHRGNSFP